MTVCTCHHKPFVLVNQITIKKVLDFSVKQHPKLLERYVS